MTFTLNINSENQAMVEGPAEEVGRILDEVAQQVRRGATDGRVRDSNGNTVGSWGLYVPEMCQFEDCDQAPEPNSPFCANHQD